MDRVNIIDLMILRFYYVYFKFSVFRHGLESNVLRFMAKMDSDRPIDQKRCFIISYFLCDDTILVYEPPQRNSGIIGGKFLERNRIKLPDGSGYYSSKVRSTEILIEPPRKKAKENFLSF